MGRFAYDNSAGRFEHLDGTRVVWRSDASPAFLLPDEPHMLTWTGDLDYPTFNLGNGMFYTRTAHTDGNGHTTSPDTYSSASFEIVRPGDWGPDKSGDFLLDPIVIGTVPARCNHLEIDAVFDQTLAPTFNWWGFDFIEYQKMGEHIFPDSGFLPLEAAAPWRRTVSIWLADDDNGDGDADGIGATRNVVIERRQSIAAITSFTQVTGGSLKSGQQNYTGGATGAWEGKFTHDGDPAGWPTYIMAAGSNTGATSMRGGSGQPAINHSQSYASTWSADITVRPGYVLPAS